MSSPQRLLFFEQILDQLKGDIAVFDLQHRYVYVNAYAVKDPVIRKWIVGKTDEEYCAYRGVNTELAALRRHRFAEALRTGALQEWEELMPDREGNLRAYMRRLFVVNDAAGNPEFLVGHGLEITDRWSAVNEMRLSRELLTNVLQAAPGPVAVIDSDGRFVLANNAMARLHGKSEPDLVGKTRMELNVDPRISHVMQELESTLISEGRKDCREEQLVTADGSSRWFETIRIPFNGENSKRKILVFSTDITERRLKEDLLIQNENELIEAQELAKTGSYEFRLPSLELRWSLGMYRIWEVDTSVQPSIELFYNSLHPDDVGPLLERQASIRPGDLPWTITYRVITPSGKLKFVEARSKLQSEENGTLKLVGTCQDITERKIFEQRLVDSEQRLLEAQQIARTGSWQVYVKDTIDIKWSPGVFTIFEWPPDQGEPPPEVFFSRVPEPDRTLLQDTINSMISNGIPGEVKYRFTTGSGNERMFLSRGLPETDQDGNVAVIYGTTTDITLEHQAEERLRNNERQLLMAQQIARIGSFDFDIVTNRVEWSPGMYNIFELDPEQSVPDFDQMMSTIHPDDLPSFISMLKSPSDQLDERYISTRLLLTGGKLKYLDIRYRRIVDEPLGRNKVFGTAMDVTEKKLAEEELVRARRQAEDSVKAKENFLANISHELRTPLNGILGMLRLLQKTNLNSIQKEYIDVLSHTSGNLLSIINDILDFARLESGGYSLEESVFDPAVIADTAFQLQLVKAEEKGLSMRHLHEQSEPFPRVIGDPNRLSQILLNLLNNAVKFTNQGEVLLTHRVKSITEDQAVLSFSVRDSGIGIPDDMQERIFESFTQVHASGFGGGGVGLGLTITKGLVERLGGSITLESNVNVGSVFTVDIPYRCATNDSVSPGSASLPVGLGELRVLVVEDNKVNLYITESMLQTWGLHVDVALNGEEAVRMAEENGYDLILMDIQMPVMDGLEATRRIRRFRNSARASVPVVAVTANTSRLAHKNLIMEGMNDCLVKPFREDQLFRKIVSNVNRDSLPARTVPKRKFPQRRSPGGKSKALYDLSLLMRDDPGNDAFLKRMLSIFIETIPASVTTMEECFDKEDWEAVSILAHKIKPTLDGTGINSVRETIRNIESFQEKKRSTAQLGEDIKALRKIIDEVVLSFRKEVERIQS